MVKKGKVRLDALLVERGFFTSREQARRAIMAGLVFYEGRRVEKAGEFVDPNGVVEVKGNPCPYVSRGGLKLEGALRCFGVDVSGKVALDAGASTGGFTHCLLEHGAKRVYAVDVGYGQLAWQLRQDPRVVVRERTNIRYLKPDDLGTRVDLVTLDLSFISLEKVLPAVWELLNDGGEVIALVKPQFEAGREHVGKGGIVKDPEVHYRVLERIIGVSAGIGFQVKGLTYSPLLGADGNAEFFLWLAKGDSGSAVLVSSEDIRRVVETAHKALLGKDGGN
ncbi:MAG: TlyA family RNA methyltransferase [Thermacetogeniaceae bacterium]